MTDDKLREVSELADDLRYIAAHTNDPRNEERIYEGADAIDALAAVTDAAETFLAAWTSAEDKDAEAQAAIALGRALRSLANKETGK